MELSVGILMLYAQIEERSTGVDMDIGGPVRGTITVCLSSDSSPLSLSVATYLTGCLTATSLNVRIAAKRRAGLEEDRNSCSTVWGMVWTVWSRC